MSPRTPKPLVPSTNVRVVTLRLRAELIGLGIALGVLAALEFVLRAQKGLTLIAVAIVLSLAVVVFGLLGLIFIPPFVTQVSHFVSALRVLADDLTKGHGPLEFLERKYHVVKSIRDATRKPSSGALSGAATTFIGTVIIAFLTLLMLLEGPEWRRRVLDLIPERHMLQAGRIGAGVYRSVRGFVTGNVLASLLARAVATVTLLLVGVRYALPLGRFTVIVELIPYIGPAVITVLLSLVALTDSPHCRRNRLRPLAPLPPDRGPDTAPTHLRPRREAHNLGGPDRDHPVHGSRGHLGDRTRHPDRGFCSGDRHRGVGRTGARPIRQCCRGTSTNRSRWLTVSLPVPQRHHHSRSKPRCARRSRSQQ